MPEIGLANNVTLEYDEDDIEVGADYEFTEPIPQLGDFATAGTRFTLASRREDEEKDGKYIFIFRTQDGVKFQLVEDTFASYIEDELIIKHSS